MTRTPQAAMDARLTAPQWSQAGCVLEVVPLPKTPAPSALQACTRTMRTTPQLVCLAAETGRKQATRSETTETQQMETAAKATA